MKTSCRFCSPDLKKDWIFENRHFYALFDIHPVSPGHALVISKKHVVSLFNLNQEQWQFLGSAICETVKVIEKTDFTDLYRLMAKKKLTDKSPYFCRKMLQHVGVNRKPKSYNIGNNEGVVAGRTVHHLHVQIIPRYRGDVKNPIGGIRTIVPGLGDYKG